MDDMKRGMLAALAEFRRAVRDETTDFNVPEVRAALAQFLDTLEAYVIDREQW